VDLTLPKKDGVETTLGIAYEVAFDLYGNDYNGYGGDSGSVKGTLSYVSTETITETAALRTTTDSNLAQISEKSALRNTITPAFKVTKDINDRLRLGFKALAAVGINKDTSKNHREDRTVVLVESLAGTPENGAYSSIVRRWERKEISETSFSIAPEFRAGLQYRLIPDRFVLNGGVLASFNFTRTSTRTTPGGFEEILTYREDGYGNVLQNNDYSVLPVSQTDSLTIERSFDDLTALLTGGFTFYFTPGFSADAAFSAGVANSSWNLNLTSVRILFTLKK
jgi:hypothetical protein